MLDPGDQPQRERDRDRVVAAGLRLERPGEPPANVGEAKRREHGGRVRGRHDGAEQHRLEPRQVEERICGDPGEERRDYDSHRAEQRRRHGHAPQPPPRRLQPSFVQDSARPTMPTSRASVASSKSIPPGPSEPRSIPRARNATSTGSPVRVATRASTMLAEGRRRRRGALRLRPRRTA